jgi:hypothetical protein
LWAGTAASAPLKEPTGVRVAAAMTTGSEDIPENPLQAMDMNGMIIETIHHAVATQKIPGVRR